MRNGYPGPKSSGPCPPPPNAPTVLPPEPLTRAEGNALIKKVRQDAVDLASARLAAQRCGIREGETLAEFIRRLHDEANEDRE